MSETIAVLVTYIEGELAVSVHPTIADAENQIRWIWDEETHGLRTKGLSGDDLFDAVTTLYEPGKFAIDIQSVDVAAELRK